MSEYTNEPHELVEARDAWRDAVIDELVICGIYNESHDHNPRKALHDAILWNVQVALNPLVSSDAVELMERGRDSIIEECAAVCGDLRQEWGGLKVGAYDGRYDMMEEAATVCEDAIRALKGKK